MKKRISVDQLKPGMHVVGMEQSWLKTPFWIHRKMVITEKAIRQLKASGVHMVFIDPEVASEVEELDDSLLKDEKLLSDLERGEHGSFHQEHTQKPLEISSPPQEDSTNENGRRRRVSQEELAKAREIREEAILGIERIFEGIKTGAPLQAGPVRELARNLLDQVILNEHSMFTEIQLQRMKSFDPTLFTHSVDVCVMSIIVGKEEGVGKDQLQALTIGALLHDVGQLRLPRNLLLKTEVFSPEERKLFEAHPQLGAMMVKSTEGIPLISQRIVAEHHERIDGSGHPWGRVGSMISPLAQLVGMIDRYDALITSRGGRPTIPPALAIGRMYQLGMEGQFDMGWINRLIHCFSIYPIGSLVELNTGERGWVVGINQNDRMRPTVKVIWGPGQEMMKEPVIIELASESGEHSSRKIQRVLNPIEEGVDASPALVW